MKKEFNLKKIARSFMYAFAGFAAAFKRERNMKIHIMVASIILVLGIFFRLTANDWLFITLAIGLVIGFELLNTAIEDLIDISVQGYNVKAKFVKDVFAASVLILSFTSAIIGIIIFLPKIMELIGGL